MKSHHPQSAGFSLLELLTVAAILAIVLSFVVPAFNTIATGSNLTLAGQLVADQVAMARQEAVSKNWEVRVVLFSLPDGTASRWSGLQLWRVETTSTNTTSIPIGKVHMLPRRVEIAGDESLSPLLTTHAAGTTSLQVYGSVPYVWFSFRPNGSLESAVNRSNNFLTLQNVNGKASSADYFTIQVNPVTGKAIVYRP